jgi:hypothetical protein
VHTRAFEGRLGLDEPLDRSKRHVSLHLALQSPVPINGEQS